MVALLLQAQCTAEKRQQRASNASRELVIHFGEMVAGRGVVRWIWRGRLGFHWGNGRFGGLVPVQCGGLIAQSTQHKKGGQAPVNLQHRPPRKSSTCRVFSLTSNVERLR